MKKHKFLSIFAIMFALVFALSICFFAACGNKEDNNDDTTVTIPDDDTKDEDTTEDESEGDDTTKDEDDEKSDDDEKKDEDEKKEDDEKQDDDDEDELLSVSIDFSKPETYSWIKTTSATYTNSNEVTTTYDNAIIGEANESGNLSTDESGLVTIVGTYSPDENEPMRVDSDSEGTYGTYLTTAGSTQNKDSHGGRYIAINTAGYEGRYVTVETEFCSGNTEGRSLLFGSSKTAKETTDANVEAYTTSSDKGDNVTLKYAMEIPEDCETLYLTCTKNIWIYKVDVTISATSDYVEAPTRIDVYSDGEAVESLALVIPTGYNYDGITTGQSELELVTANLEAAAVNEHNLKFVYSGKYTWKSSNEGIVVVDENGIITAVGEGKAEVTVCLEGTPEVCTTLEVEVNYPAQVEKIMYTWEYSMTMVTDESNLTVTVIMSDGNTYNGGYSWEVSGDNDVLNIGTESEGTVCVGWIGYGTGVLTLTLDGDYGSYSITFSADEDTMVCTLAYDTIFEEADNG